MVYLQLGELREQMCALQKERHRLWAQLKQVLGAEEEQRKKLQSMRQQKERDIWWVAASFFGIQFLDKKI